MTDVIKRPQENVAKDFQADDASVPEPVMEIERLRHVLKDATGEPTFVLDIPESLSIPQGSMVAILGPSGCGKTTLLSILGLLRRPTELTHLSKFRFSVGRNGQDAIDLKACWIRGYLRKIEWLRRTYLGFALQSGELVTSLTVAENIATPLRLNGVPMFECRDRVNELLQSFQLTRFENGSNRHSLANSRINRLSGGQYQRVALARAIAHRPKLVFVDEPTAALNREMARGALEILKRTQVEQGGATVMVTHDESLAFEFCEVIIRLAAMKDRPGGHLHSAVVISDRDIKS